MGLFLSHDCLPCHEHAHVEPSSHQHAGVFPFAQCGKRPSLVCAVFVLCLCCVYACAHSLLAFCCSSLLQLQQLKDWGVSVVDPVVKTLACGDTGEACACVCACVRVRACACVCVRVFV